MIIINIIIIHNIMLYDSISSYEYMFVVLLSYLILSETGLQPELGLGRGAAEGARDLAHEPRTVVIITIIIIMIITLLLLLLLLLLLGDSKDPVSKVLLGGPNSKKQNTQIFLDHTFLE